MCETVPSVPDAEVTSIVVSSQSTSRTFVAVLVDRSMTYIFPSTTAYPKAPTLTGIGVFSSQVISVAKLAEATGLQRSQVSLWINGNPTLQTLVRLGDMLGVPVWKLLDPSFDASEHPPPTVMQNKEED